MVQATFSLFTSKKSFIIGSIQKMIAQVSRVALVAAITDSNFANLSPSDSKCF